MKKTSKVLATIVALSFCFISLTGMTVHAETIDDSSTELFEKGYTEVVNIDGNAFRFQLSSEEDGTRVIETTDITSNHTDVMTYNESEGVIYLNGELFGTVTDLPISEDLETNRLPAELRANWIWMSSYNRYVTWEQSLGATAVATAISIVLGSLGPGGVIAAMGMGVLAAICAAASGGTVYGDLYKFNSPLVTQWKYDWRFRTSAGGVYGPFTGVSPIV